MSELETEVRLATRNRTLMFQNRTSNVDLWKQTKALYNLFGDKPEVLGLIDEMVGVIDQLRDMGKVELD